MVAFHDRMEVAGVFGDLSTLVPLKTTLWQQPMKTVAAIATTQGAQTIVITPAMVWATSFARGMVWLLLGLTGTARYGSRAVNGIRGLRLEC
jgi:hypothetical protein